MKKYQYGHSMWPIQLIGALAFAVILTLGALGAGVASIWIESIRTGAAWLGVVCAVFWAYVAYTLFDEEVRDYLRDLGP